MLGIKLSDKQHQIAILVSAASLLLVTSVGLKSCYDHRVISNHETEVKAQVLEKTVKSNNEAAARRAVDAINNTKKDDERHEAIDQTIDEKPTDADNALNCVRLRQAGTDTTSFPACRGR